MLRFIRRLFGLVVPEDEPPTQVHGEMTEESKRLFDSHLALAEFWWDAFNRRREYDWKISISLWTAIAAFVAVILTADLSRIGVLPKIAVTMAAVLIPFAHARWMKNITAVNKHDKKKASLYVAKCNEIIGMQLSSDIRKKDDEYSEQSTKILRNWSSWFHLLITMILCALAILFLWFADPGEVRQHIYRAESSGTSIDQVCRW